MHRSVPFTGKKKRAQLKEKRAKKREQEQREQEEDDKLHNGAARTSRERSGSLSGVEKDLEALALSDGEVKVIQIPSASKQAKPQSQPKTKSSNAPSTASSSSSSLLAPPKPSYTHSSPTRSSKSPQAKSGDTGTKGDRFEWTEEEDDDTQTETETDRELKGEEEAEEEEEGSKRGDMIELDACGRMHIGSRAEVGDKRTFFRRIPKEEIEKHKLKAQQPLSRLPPSATSLSLEELIASESIDIPERPPWTETMSKVEIERQEQAYFGEWLKRIYARFGMENLNYFEHNLEVWRQLWRTLEMSDILLLLLDARNPWYTFPSALHAQIAVRLRKPVVLVLNKADLTEDKVLAEWIRFFNTLYPSTHVHTFTTKRLVDESSQSERGGKSEGRGGRLGGGKDQETKESSSGSGKKEAEVLFRREEKAREKEMRRLAGVLGSERGKNKKREEEEEEQEEEEEGGDMMSMTKAAKNKQRKKQQKKEKARSKRVAVTGEEEEEEEEEEKEERREREKEEEEREGGGGEQRGKKKEERAGEGSEDEEEKDKRRAAKGKGKEKSKGKHVESAEEEEKEKEEKKEKKSDVPKGKHGKRARRYAKTADNEGDWWDDRKKSQKEEEEEEDEEEEEEEEVHKGRGRGKGGKGRGKGKKGKREKAKEDAGMKKHKRLGRVKRKMETVGMEDILRTCEAIGQRIGKQINWQGVFDRYDRLRRGVRMAQLEAMEWEALDKQYQQEIEENLKKNFHGGTHQITIGMVGCPNVGKSSLINGLFGKKVVSTSRTPGHTKHFQHIFLAPGVRLMDCPGLVFPVAHMPRQLQILSGVYPIAQCSEPYSSILYLAERFPVEAWYGLRMDSGKEGREKDRAERKAWSAWQLCEKFAIKHSFYTANSGRPDVYRAANYILRDVCEGRVPFFFRPPDGSTLQQYVARVQTQAGNGGKSGPSDQAVAVQEPGAQ